jgi:hypothetical protein
MLLIESAGDWYSYWQCQIHVKTSCPFNHVNNALHWIWRDFMTPYIPPPDTRTFIQYPASLDLPVWLYVGTPESGALASHSSSLPNLRPGTVHVGTSQDTVHGFPFLLVQYYRTPDIGCLPVSSRHRPGIFNVKTLTSTTWHLRRDSYWSHNHLLSSVRCLCVAQSFGTCLVLLSVRIASDP